jgi:crotonobetainyl-CoA:carnitine CoA-transferase CaiB-like acyl-CoA transferase
MTAPLHGVHVVALTDTPTTAYAAHLLARLGAEVLHIALDPGADDGVDLMRALLPTTDVVLEDCAPRVLGEAGLSVEDTRAAHPATVWCALKPVAGEAQADLSAAWHAVAAILLALHHRAAAGAAQRIDVEVGVSHDRMLAAVPPETLPLRFVPSSTIG